MKAVATWDGFQFFFSVSCQRGSQMQLHHPQQRAIKIPNINKFLSLRGSVFGGAQRRRLPSLGGMFHRGRPKPKVHITSDAITGREKRDWKAIAPRRWIQLKPKEKKNRPPPSVTLHPSLSLCCPQGSVFCTRNLYIINIRRSSSAGRHDANAAPRVLNAAFSFSCGRNSSVCLRV